MPCDPDFSLNIGSGIFSVIDMATFFLVYAIRSAGAHYIYPGPCESIPDLGLMIAFKSL
jgi:hypothetical protein